MRCPKCKAELVHGKGSRYETLVEHVMDPNMENYPVRPAFVCPNKCLGGFYDPYGDFYEVTLEQKVDTATL